MGVSPMANGVRRRSTSAVACTLVVTLSSFSYFAHGAVAAEETPAAGADDTLAKDRAFNAAKARHQKHIDDLRKESLEDSLERLCLIGAYYLGDIYEEDALIGRFPVGPGPGKFDVHRLMSNRRLVKVFQELSAMPKPRATVILHRHLQASLKEYDRLFAAQMQERVRRRGVGDALPQGMFMAISDDGNVAHATWFARRLQVLALVLLAGNLELPELAADVRAVAKRGVEQYADFQDDTKYEVIIGVLMTSHGSLYSRQTLAIGLLGTCPNRDDPTVREYMARLRTMKLAPFDAPRTPYERLMFMGEGPMGADATPLAMRYLADPSDADIEKIITAVSRAVDVAEPARPSVE